jgi:hypothetical protein
MSRGEIPREEEAKVPRKLSWLAALVLLAAMGGLAPAGDPDYGIPDPPVTGLPRPYSQRSFRGYYLHRLIQECRKPSVESYPHFEIDVTPSYAVTRYPCPYVYPSQLYTVPRVPSNPNESK